MADLIDRQALLKELRADYRDAMKDQGEGQLIAIGLESAIGIVKGAPSSGETVQHGKWVVSDIPCEKFKCSVCGGGAWYYDYEGDVSKSRFCPNCGAKMDGEAK